MTAPALRQRAQPRAWPAPTDAARGPEGGSRPLASPTSAAARAPADLAASYELCRRLNAVHGRTYYFAARFLPRERRKHVHALYAFARFADDLVDRMDSGWSPQRRRRALESWAGEFLEALDRGRSDEPLLAAVVDTVGVLAISRADLQAFLRSMAMDLEVTRYPTYADLADYMHGSAAVIGSMTLGVLGPRHPDARARAMDLGVAFQLTNFLRDVAEDWDRGRIYLPLEDLDRFGVTEADFRSRRTTPPLRRLLSFEAARTRRLYARAEAGWAMLEPRSRACVRIAHRLYAEILVRLERADWDVFGGRASVPLGRKLTVAARECALPSRPCRPPGPRTSPGEAVIGA